VNEQELGMNLTEFQSVGESCYICLWPRSEQVLFLLAHWPNEKCSKVISCHLRGFFVNLFCSSERSKSNWAFCLGFEASKRYSQNRKRIFYCLNIDL